MQDGGTRECEFTIFVKRPFSLNFKSTTGVQRIADPICSGRHRAAKADQETSCPINLNFRFWPVADVRSTRKKRQQPIRCAKEKAGFPRPFSADG
jgi:hypothetical protein